MIRRELYLSRIRPFMGTDLVKVITGMRRSGKSVMLDLIKEDLISSGVPRENIISLNFESLDNAGLCTAESLWQELSTRIRGISGQSRLFLDEIQEVASWERCINSLRADFDCDIYITGSNARLLSGELATLLGGRYAEFTIYPFSLREYAASRQGSSAESGAVSQDTLKEYLQYGGMPFLSHIPGTGEVAIQYLTDLYNSIVLKDVATRNRVRDLDLLQRIILFVISNTGRTFSARSIAGYLKSEGRTVAPETVLNYVRYCCDACLLQRIGRSDLSGKKLLSVNEKYYLTDHGIREAVYGGGLKDIELLMENVICMELIRRRYKVTVGRYGDREIDFVADRDGKRIYVQSSYLLASPETVQREFGVLDHIRDNFPKYVVTMDELDMSRNGIRHLHLKEFLLAEDWD